MLELKLAQWMEAQHKLIKEGKTMDVFSTEIETTEDGIGVDFTEEEAEMLRRVCQFNKTISKRVAERDGEDAGDAINEFLCDLGDQLADEGIDRWDPRD